MRIKNPAAKRDAQRKLQELKEELWGDKDEEDWGEKERDWDEDR